jgi:superfamily II DNA or RNA helicase
MYLPKEGLNLAGVKQALTFYHQDNTEFYQYHELYDHLVIPRYFLDHSIIAKKRELVDLRPKKYKKVEIQSNITLRDTMQEASARAIENKSGVLVLPCGTGKTIVALHEISRRSEPTLIIVNTEQIMDQWAGGKDGIKKFLGVARVGKIQAKTFDWEAPIVIATIQTLAKRRNMLTERIRRFFGLVIWDEVDEMATPIYSRTADMFYGDRLGLTATPYRRDGAERIFNYHMGPTLYEDRTFKKIPRVTFVSSPAILIEPEYVNVWDNKVNYGKLYTALSTNESRNEVIITIVDKKLHEGRKILVIGERKAQLRKLRDFFGPIAGLCVHEVEIQERWRMLDECKVIFAIRRLSKRALNQKDLNTLIILYPVTDPEGLRQACGRILRDDYKEPEVIVLRDTNIPTIVDSVNKMEKIFNSWNFPVAHKNLKN